MILSKEEIKLKIFETRGQIFNASFTKKDGSTRVMNCRLGVKKYLRGGILNYDPNEFNLICVFDMVKKGYRMINVNTLNSVSIKGEIYNIKI